MNLRKYAKRLGRKVLPTAQKVVRVAAPLLGAVAAGPVGAGFGAAAATGFSRYAGGVEARKKGLRGGEASRYARKQMKTAAYIGAGVTATAGVLAVAGGTSATTSSVTAFKSTFGMSGGPGGAAAKPVANPGALTEFHPAGGLPSSFTPPVAGAQTTGTLAAQTAASSGLMKTIATTAITTAGSVATNMLTGITGRQLPNSTNDFPYQNGPDVYPSGGDGGAGGGYGPGEETDKPSYLGWIIAAAAAFFLLPKLMKKAA